MRQYSKKLRANALEMLEPPHNLKPAQAALMVNVSPSSVYLWSKQEREHEHQIDSTWSNEQKIQALLDTAVLSENELRAYCLENEPTVPLLKRWKMQLDELHRPQALVLPTVEAASIAQKRIEELENELNRKNKALADAMLLLVSENRLHALR